MNIIDFDPRGKTFHFLLNKIRGLKAFTTNIVRQFAHSLYITCLYIICANWRSHFHRRAFDSQIVISM